MTRLKTQLDEVTAHRPDLQVIFTPHCHGSAWIVDTDTDTVYIDGAAAPSAAAVSLLDALDALCAHHGIRHLLTTHTARRNRLRLLPGGRNPCLRTTPA